MRRDDLLWTTCDETTHCGFGEPGTGDRDSGNTDSGNTDSFWDSGETFTMRVAAYWDSLNRGSRNFDVSSRT